MRQRGFATLLIVVLVLLLVGVGAYVWQRSSHLEEMPKVIIDTSPSPSSPNKTKELKTVTIPQAGIELQVPSELAKNFTSTEKPGETGMLLIAGSGDLYIGGTSKDFSAGREGGFTDTQGYSIKNGKYYFKFVNDRELEITPDLANASEITNSNGVKVLKITSKVENMDSPGYPWQFISKYMGAIVNTNSKYSGVGFLIETGNGLTEADFDNLINSIKYTQ